MRVRRLAIRHFRNLTNLDLEVPLDGAVIVGHNGHGKTNLLEAIYYLVLFRSFRGTHDRDAVQFGCPGFFLSGELDDLADQASPRHVTAGFETETGRKRIAVDGAESDRIGDAIGQLRAVVITPDDREIVSGAPGLRRRYLDIVLSLTRPAYLEALKRYRHALRQRNAAIRRMRRDEVEMFEPVLRESGQRIMHDRREWIDRSAAALGDLTRDMGESGDVGLAYQVADESLDYASARDRDFMRGTTTVGPHRDDVVISLNGRRMATVGSAGQQRTAATALRLLEADALGDPVLLLDDIFAELDDDRRERLAGLLEGRQRILAVPREAGVPNGADGLTRWRIDGGEVSQ